MKRIFTSPISEQVGLMQSILNSNGIPCEIRNDTISQVMVGLPFAPELWILRDKDYEEAVALVSEYNRQMPLDMESEPTAALAPGSTLKQFRTNTRLWLLVSLALFLPPWFIMDIKTGNDDIKHPIQLWLYLFKSNVNADHVVSRLIAFTLLFSISAFAIGWVIQCLVTMIQDLFIKRK
jgi:hypothetical protein